MRWPWQKEREKAEEAEQVVADEKRSDVRHRESLRLRQNDVERRLRYIEAQAAIARREGA